MLLTKEHQLFRQEISRFVAKMVVSLAKEIDEMDEFSMELFQEVRYTRWRRQ